MTTPKLVRNVLTLVDRPLTRPESDPALNRVAFLVVYAAVGVSLWYFWNVRPLWASVALLSVYFALAGYLVGRALGQRE